MPHVYAEEILLTGFAMDYLILRIPAAALCMKNRPARTAATAGAASAAALLAAALGLRGAALAAAKLAVSAGMVVSMARGTSLRGALSYAALMWASALGIGGAAYALFAASGSGVAVYSGTALVSPGAGGWLFCLCAAVFARVAACGVSSAAKKAPMRARVDVASRGAELSLDGLIDSGDSLADPLTGRPVILLRREAFEKLGFARPDASGGAPPGMYLVPYAGAGASGLLEVWKPARAAVNGRETNALVAAFPGPLRDCEALVPHELKNLAR